MKKLLITSLLLIGLSFTACYRYNYGTVEYNVKSIQATYGLVNDIGEIDSLSLDSLLAERQRRFSDIVMIVKVDEKEFLSLTKPLNLLDNTAYADPAPPKPKHRLSYIKLTSNKHLFTTEKEYEPGDDLEAVFGFTSNSNADFQSVYSYLGDMGDSWNQHDMIAFIKFRGELTKPVEQIFTVTYQFADDSEVSTSTATIKAN